MGVFSVLGNAAIGMSSMQIAPAIGTMGVVAAAGLSKAMSKDDPQYTNEDILEVGFQKGKSKDAAILTDLGNRIVVAKLQMKSSKEFDDFVISLYAVAFAAAECNNKIADSEREYIEDYLLNGQAGGLSTHVLGMIERLYYNPPMFNELERRMESVDKALWTIHNEIIDEIIYADSNIDESEMIFLTQWQQLNRRKSH